MSYADRIMAGSALAAVVAERVSGPAVVLALPRGGVPVAAAVAAALGAPLDVIVARKVGAPGRPELGIGAVGEGGTVVRDDDALRILGVTDSAFSALADAERAEVRRRVQRYRGALPLPGVSGRTVVLVDDGIATGVTAECALVDIRASDPQRLVLAAPVGARDTVARIASFADEVVCPLTPDDFVAVGQWYDRFEQTTDEEVLRLLAAAAPRRDRA